MAARGARRKITKVLLAAGIFILWLFAVQKTAGICFELNDDRCIGEILSGTMTGEPEARTVYMNWLLGLPLSMLYRVTVRVPWYGGMLALCHLAVYTGLLLGIWSRAKNRGEYGVYTGLVCCMALAGLYMTAALQYTSTAALMAAAGYGCLILRKEPGRGRVLFFCFQLAAFLLRAQAMLLVQPLGLGLCGGMYLAAEGESLREKAGKLAGMVLPLILAVLTGLGGIFFSFREQGWKEYHRFNGAEEDIFDYYGQPEYEEAKSVLDRYGVTRAEYEAYCNYVILDWVLPVECAEELAEYAEKKRQDSADALTLLKKTGEELRSDRYLGMNLAAGAAWCGILAGMLFRRRFRLALPGLGLALGRTAAWGYLVYADRLPYRVTLPLLACEFILLVCLLVKDYSEREGEARGENRRNTFLTERLPALVLCGAFALACIVTGKLQYGQALEANFKQKNFIENLVQIGDYCDAHGENRYLLDTQSVTECCGSAFETRIYGEHNYVYTGTWYSNSPGVRRHLAEYLDGGKEEFYLIVREDGRGEDHYALAYLAEKLGRKPVPEDRIRVSGGGTWLVWSFQ